jgi:hypothetical protein
MPSRMKSRTNYQMASWISNFKKLHPREPPTPPTPPVQPLGVYYLLNQDYTPFN